MFRPTAVRARPSVFLASRRLLSTSSSPGQKPGGNTAAGDGPEALRWKTPLRRRLWKNDWLDEEAENLMAVHYKSHKSMDLASHSQTVDQPKMLSTQELLDAAPLDAPQPTYKPVTFRDKLAQVMVNALKPLTHAFFRTRYNHHAVVLETVAAVPGLVMAMFRHLRSLRTMRRDHGWCQVGLDEMVNERMHLLIFMRVTQPTPLERVLVALAQGFYFGAYATMYLLSPTTAHRFVGYLEEAACEAYTEYALAIQKGDLPNVDAPKIAERYYHLPEGERKLLDVVLRVRADEMIHRNVNHFLAERAAEGATDEHIEYPPGENSLLGDYDGKESGKRE